MIMVKPKVSNKVVLILAFMVGLTVSTMPQSAASIGVVSSSGSVQLSRPVGDSTVQIPVGRGVAVLPGDVIKTGMDGRVVIELDDRSRAIISANSTVEIGNTANSPRIIFNQIRGKTRIKIENLGGKPNPYRVTTPTTVIAVRCTIFDVFLRKGETSVFVIEGEVSFSRISMPDQEVILRPGEFTSVKSNNPPEPPAPFKKDKNDTFFSSLPGGGPGLNPFERPGDAPGRGRIPGEPEFGRENPSTNNPNPAAGSSRPQGRGRP